MGSYTGPTHRLTDDSPVNMDPVTMQELSAVLKGMTAHKAAGPDNIPSEALGGQQKLPLLNLFNNALLVGVVPQDWSTAVVAEVHKRGTMADPNNYRPISLLSTSYKLFARILQERLKMATDGKLSCTQYGFRATRSSSPAIHVARRLIESARRHGSTLYVQLLDWTQAFDKLHPQAVSQALARHGAIYQSPTFTVRAAGNRSHFAQASSGIRQGCPLSPYVFLLLCAQHDYG
eukprot:s1083_g7.t1